MYCWHNEMIIIYVLRIYSDIMYICSFRENYYMCTQKYNARIHTHKPANQPAIHFEQSDTLCSYCSEWLLLLCFFLCFWEIFFGYTLFCFIIHLCYNIKIFMEISIICVLALNALNANKANTNEKATTMTTSAIFIWITFVSYRLHSTVELNFFQQSDWVYCCYADVMSYALLSTAETSKLFMLRRDGVFHHLVRLCSILFWAFQLSSVQFPVSLILLLLLH